MEATLILSLPALLVYKYTQNYLQDDFIFIKI